MASSADAWSSAQALPLSPYLPFGPPCFQQLGATQLPPPCAARALLAWQRGRLRAAGAKVAARLSRGRKEGGEANNKIRIFAWK